MNSKVVRFRVNSEQFETLKKNAILKGHISVSSYLRDLAFKKSFSFEKKIYEIHEEVVNGRENKSARMDQNLGKINF